VTKMEEQHMRMAGRHGFVLEDVPKEKCVMCGKQIGKREYEEITKGAITGHVLFAHQACLFSEKIGDHETIS